jgi:hypothetical protein
MLLQITRYFRAFVRPASSLLVRMIKPPWAGVSIILSMLTGMVLVALAVLKPGDGVLESELFLFELNASATHLKTVM